MPVLLRPRRRLRPGRHFFSHGKGCRGIGLKQFCILHNNETRRAMYVCWQKAGCISEATLDEASTTSLMASDPLTRTSHSKYHTNARLRLFSAPNSISSSTAKCPGSQEGSPVDNYSTSVGSTNATNTTSLVGATRVQKLSPKW